MPGPLSAPMFADPAQAASLFWRYLGAVALYTGVLVVLILAVAQWLRRHPRLLQALNRAQPPRGMASARPMVMPWNKMLTWAQTGVSSKTGGLIAASGTDEAAAAGLVLEASLPLEPGRTTYLVRAAHQHFLLGCSEQGITLLAALSPCQTPMPTDEAPQQAPVPAEGASAPEAHILENRP